MTKSKPAKATKTSDPAKPATGAKRGPKPGTKRAPKDPSKKTTQTTLKSKAAPKKRKKADTEDEGNDSDEPSLHHVSVLSATPPSAKKQKKTLPKKTGAKPLREIENDAISEAIDASMMLDGSPDEKPKKGSKSTEQYQKVGICCSFVLMGEC